VITVRLKADTTYDTTTVRLKADTTYDTTTVRLKADTTYAFLYGFSTGAPTRLPHSVHDPS
jgi:hypothetical protein